MYSWVLALFLVSSGSAADERQRALAVRAQTDFERVELAAAPRVSDAVTCVQAQAALLPVATAQETPVVHYRKGYCALAGATLTGNPGEFAAAAAEFEKAIEAWPVRLPNAPRNRAPEPVPSGLRALAWIARLQAGAGRGAMDRVENDLAMAVEAQVCPGSAMPAPFCAEVLETGREWLGWIALERGDLYAAARRFSAAGSGWKSWVLGKQAAQERRYGEAAALYRQALDAWSKARQAPGPSMAQRLEPQPNLGLALTEMGGAQLLAGDAAAAIATLDAAAKADPGYARTFYLRARAKEAAGQTEAGIADYNLAGRTAFAGAKDLASGEAHLYRGIVLYRRKDLVRAEDEFSNALNFDISPDLKPDAEGWRHMAAVAGGSCGAAKDSLERSLETVSPYFPKEEARKLAIACSGANTPIRSLAFPGPAQRLPLP